MPLQLPRTQYLFAALQMFSPFLALRTRLISFGVASTLVAAAPSALAFALQGFFKGAPIENAPDPCITSVSGKDGRTHWYMYSTTDPINDNDRTATGGYNFR